MRVLKMDLEWEPDPENIYLTSGGHDNLAIHQAPEGFLNESPHQRLDHIGFILPSPEDVDDWYAWVKSQGATIAKELKTHRDGARSFYLTDPDGVIIQMMYHPPIAKSTPVASRK